MLATNSAIVLGLVFCFGVLGAGMVGLAFMVLALGGLIAWMDPKKPEHGGWVVWSLITALGAWSLSIASLIWFLREVF